MRFLTTLAGDALVSITYNRPIDADGAWEAAATALSEALGPGPGGKPVKTRRKPSEGTPATKHPTAT